MCEILCYTTAPNCQSAHPTTPCAPAGQLMMGRPMQTSRTSRPWRTWNNPALRSDVVTLRARRFDCQEVPSHSRPPAPWSRPGLRVHTIALAPLRLLPRIPPVPSNTTKAQRRQIIQTTPWTTPSHTCRTRAEKYRWARTAKPAKCEGAEGTIAVSRSRSNSPPAPPGPYF